ncbi:hypothetical protein [Actinoplanes sp. URMC 104]|uniref:hypothetical protein n=1 Tax=Actinoplanes sp. URMC 104 TaxID=3423409 RepID=UPI003F1D0D8E
MFRTAEPEARSTIANEMAALLRAEYVASGDRAYLHAASLVLSRFLQGATATPEATPAR